MKARRPNVRGGVLRRVALGLTALLLVYGFFGAGFFGAWVFFGAWHF